VGKDDEVRAISFFFFPPGKDFPFFFSLPLPRQINSLEKNEKGNGDEENER